MRHDEIARAFESIGTQLRFEIACRHFIATTFAACASRTQQFELASRIELFIGIRHLDAVFIALYPRCIEAKQPIDMRQTFIRCKIGDERLELQRLKFNGLRQTHFATKLPIRCKRRFI